MHVQYKFVLAYQTLHYIVKSVREVHRTTSEETLGERVESSGHRHYGGEPAEMCRFTTSVCTEDG